MKTIRFLDCGMAEAEKHLSQDELEGVKAGRIVLASAKGAVWIETAENQFVQQNFLGQIVIPESYKWGARS